jgi:dipeptidyl aminopeptidase/acylaminoacyl peptidase
MNRWLKVGLASAAVVALAGAVTARYMAHSLTRAKRVSIQENPASHGLEYEDVSFPTEEDGATLRGWYLRAKTGDRCVIMTHGGEYHRADPNIGTLGIAEALVAHGYDVLMFDLRGHGQSDDGRMSGGYYEKRDLEGAIGYVEGRGIVPQRILLLGFSLGAAASLLAAADHAELPAVVADSCWADLMDLIRSQINRRRGMPGILTPLIPRVAKAVYGVDIDETRPLDAVSKIAPRPMLFIHGELDRTVPVESALRLRHAGNSDNSKLWVVPEARHVGSYRARPEEYITRITAFFDQALKQQEAG